MSAPLNTFKAALAAGHTQIGCWLGLADGYAAEISAHAGFDWLVVDGEHAPNDLRSTLRQLQVIDPSPSHAVVRLPVGEAWLVKRTLDIGAQTLLIPMVETADQARALVQATRYPPHGQRGVGAALGRATRFAQIENYVETADSQICLLIQIESRAGLDALDEILTVEGVDGVFIGPGDLAADLGFSGRADSPEVREIILDMIRRIAGSDKAAGVLATDAEFADACLRAGAQFVAVGIDIFAFAGAMRSLADRFRRASD